MVVLFFIKIFKISYKTTYLRILNISLILIFIFNSVFYANLWNKFCSFTENYLKEKEYINIAYNNYYQIFTSQQPVFNLYHVHLYPMFIILLENMNNKKI